MTPPINLPVCNLATHVFILLSHYKCNFSVVFGTRTPFISSCATESTCLKLPSHMLVNHHNLLMHRAGQPCHSDTGYWAFVCFQILWSVFPRIVQPLATSFLRMNTRNRLAHDWPFTFLSSMSHHPLPCFSYTCHSAFVSYKEAFCLSGS